jgi:hypothetical protein
LCLLDLYFVITVFYLHFWIYLIEEQVFEPGQRALGVDLSALEEDVTVALEVVARRSRPQAQAVRADAADDAGSDLQSSF